MNELMQQFGEEINLKEVEAMEFPSNRIKQIMNEKGMSLQISLEQAKNFGCETLEDWEGFLENLDNPKKSKTVEGVTIYPVHNLLKFLDCDPMLLYDFNKPQTVFYFKDGKIVGCQKYYGEDQGYHEIFDKE